MTVMFSLLALALAADPQAIPAGDSSRGASTARQPELAQRTPSKTPSGPPGAPPPSSGQAPKSPPAGASPAAKPPPNLPAAAPRPKPEPSRFRVGARVGSFVPRTELAAGPLFALEAGYLLPIEALRDRLWLSLSVGFISVAQRSQKFIPGRGFDQGFLQRTWIVPIELSATYDVLVARPGSPGLAAGAGYGLYPTSTEFTAFNTPTTERAAGQAAFAVVRGSLPLGAGLAFLDVRYAEAHASLGPLGDVGTSNLSGFAFAAGYSLDL